MDHEPNLEALLDSGKLLINQGRAHRVGAALPINHLGTHILVPVRVDGSNIVAFGYRKKAKDG